MVEHVTLSLSKLPGEDVPANSEASSSFNSASEAIQEESQPRIADVGHARARSIELAVIWVEKGRKGSDRWVDECSEEQLRAYRLRKRLKWLFGLIKYGSLLLALFEEPSWCLGDDIPCADKQNGMYSAEIPYLPYEISNTLELVMVVFFMFRIWLRRKSLRELWTHGPWQTSAILLVVISFLDCAVGVFNTRGIVPTRFRVSRFCRPFVFLVFTKSLRLTAARVARSIPKFLDVLFSLALCVLFFVWIGLILFARTEEGEKQFPTFFASFASVWILFTTANFPDVMIASYNEQRLTFIFFFAYLVVSLYLLNNVLLVAVYDAYKEQLKTSLSKFYQKQRRSIDHAFALLADSSREISLDRWQAFFTCYCDPTVGVLGANDPSGSDYNMIRGNFVFQMLDTDCSRGLSLEEFRLITSVFSDMRIPRKRAPQVWRLSWAKSLQNVFMKGMVIRGRRIAWDSVVNCAIFVDMIITFIATIIFVTPADGGRFAWVWTYDQIWYWIAFGFSAFYFAEVTLKICLLGPDRFWNRSPFKHRCDLFIVYTLFVGEVFYLLCAPTENFVRALVLLRIIRMFRLVEHVRPIQHLATLLARLVPIYWNMGLLLVIVYYIYATVGIQLFGGLITTTNQALDGSAFKDDKYWALNFNDFFSACVTLFSLMVVNNWFVIADGFLRVSGTQWSALFFVSFFIVTNLIVLNILMALILDSSASLREELERIARCEPRSSEPSICFEREDIMRRMLLADEEFEVTSPAVVGNCPPPSTQLPAPARSLAFQGMGGGEHVWSLFRSTQSF